MFELILLIISIPLALFSFSEILKAEKNLNLGTNTLLDKRFWYTPRDVQSFFTLINDRQGQKGLDLYVWIHTVPDVIFPLAYGTLLATLIFYFNGAEINWKLAIPILTVIFDFGENFTTASLAKSYPNISSFVAWFAYGCTFLKWIMFFFSLILIFMGFGQWIKAVIK